MHGKMLHPFVTYSDKAKCFTLANYGITGMTAYDDDKTNPAPVRAAT